MLSEGLPHPAAKDVKCSQLTGAQSHSREFHWWGAGGIEPDSITFAACQAFVDEWVVVEEAEIADAMLQTRHHTGMQIEGEALKRTPAACSCWFTGCTFCASQFKRCLQTSKPMRCMLHHATQVVMPLLSHAYLNVAMLLLQALSIC